MFEELDSEEGGDDVEVDSTSHLLTHSLFNTHTHTPPPPLPLLRLSSVAPHPDDHTLCIWGFWCYKNSVF